MGWKWKFAEWGDVTLQLNKWNSTKFIEKDVSLTPRAKYKHEPSAFFHLVFLNIKIRCERVLFEGMHGMNKWIYLWKRTHKSCHWLIVHIIRCSVRLVGSHVSTMEMMGIPIYFIVMFFLLSKRSWTQLMSFVILC